VLSLWSSNFNNTQTNESSKIKSEVEIKSEKMADTNKLATDKPAIVDSNFTPVQPLAYLNKDNVVFDSAPLAQYVKT